MRVWDIHPGYLNRQSLLGEHRELHGLVKVLTENKKGYSKHPETLRWAGYGWALKQRHALLSAEMALRGYRDKTPVLNRSARGIWPEVFIDSPFEQFQILREKYAKKASGRIPLPCNAQQMWSQHKYSILARDPALYRSIGQRVTDVESRKDYDDIALQLILVLRITPSPDGLLNAMQHMLGDVSKTKRSQFYTTSCGSPTMLYKKFQCLALESGQINLLHSTALSELGVFIKK
jgi:hypothetical protein